MRFPIAWAILTTCGVVAAIAWDISLIQAGPSETVTLTPSATAPVASASLTIQFRVPEVITVTFTCPIPDPSGDGFCDIPVTTPVGTTVATFVINGAPAAYTGTPTFTEATNSLKMSGHSIVTAVSPLTAATYSATISGSQ